MIVVAGSVSGWNGWNIHDSQGNGYTNAYTNCNQAGSQASTLSCAVWTLAKATGSDTITIGCTPGGCGFTGNSWVDQWTNVGAVALANYHGDCGLANCVVNSGTDSLQASGGSVGGSTVWEAITLQTSSSGSAPTLTASSSGSDGVAPAPQTQNNCSNGGGVNTQACTFRTLSTANFPILRVGYSGSGCGSAGCTVDDHSIVFLVGGTTGTPTTTACFGNCGSPPVTLVNTNSTHTVNFNTSLTLLYVFQPMLNGYINNVTVNLAKSYTDALREPFLAFYTATCGATQTPGTTACPFLQIASINTGQLSKGRATMPLGPQFTISSNTWVAIGVSGQFSGLDLNNTNAAAIMQQTVGFVPTVINSMSSFSQTSSVGLWAFITGTVPSLVPAPPGNFSCSGLLDCVLPNLVFSFCSSGTPACQNGSALIWSGLLALFFSAFTFWGFGETMPKVHLPIGEVFLFWVLVWILVVSGMGLLYAWVPLFFFFVISLLYGRQTGRFL